MNMQKPRQQPPPVGAAMRRALLASTASTEPSMVAQSRARAELRDRVSEILVTGNSSASIGDTRVFHSIAMGSVAGAGTSTVPEPPPSLSTALGMMSQTALAVLPTMPPSELPPMTGSSHEERRLGKPRRLSFGRHPGSESFREIVIPIGSERLTDDELRAAISTEYAVRACEQLGVAPTAANQARLLKRMPLERCTITQVVHPGLARGERRNCVSIVPAFARGSGDNRPTEVEDEELVLARRVGDVVAGPEPVPEMMNDVKRRFVFPFNQTRHGGHAVAPPLIPLRVPRGSNARSLKSTDVRTQAIHASDFSETAATHHNDNLADELATQRADARFEMQQRLIRNLRGEKVPIEDEALRRLVAASDEQLLNHAQLRLLEEQGRESTNPEEAVFRQSSSDSDENTRDCSVAARPHGSTPARPPSTPSTLFSSCGGPVVEPLHTSATVEECIGMLAPTSEGYPRADLEEVHEQFLRNLPLVGLFGADTARWLFEALRSATTFNAMERVCQFFCTCCFVDPARRCDRGRVSAFLAPTWLAEHAPSVELDRLFAEMVAACEVAIKGDRVSELHPGRAVTRGAVIFLAIRSGVRGYCLRRAPSMQYVPYHETILHDVDCMLRAAVDPGDVYSQIPQLQSTPHALRLAQQVKRAGVGPFRRGGARAVTSSSVRLAVGARSVGIRHLRGGRGGDAATHLTGCAADDPRLGASGTTARGSALLQCILSHRIGESLLPVLQGNRST